MLAGGVVFMVSLLAFAAAPGFAVLLAAATVFSPASGAFVGLAQATWMDLEPDTTERNMARWVVAGSAGALVGPLVLGALVSLGRGWRAATLATAVCAVPLVIAAARLRFPEPHPEINDLRAAFRGAIAALRSRTVLRWLALMELADLLGDVFLGYLALYLVDVAGGSPQLAGIAVAVFAGSGLVGEAVLVRLLGRLDGSRVLRWTATGSLLAYPAFLIAHPVDVKIALLVPIGLLGAGWYAVPKGRLYAELPARGGTALAVGSPANLAGSLLPLAIGAAASSIGLGSAMWLLLGAPIALLVLLPRGDGAPAR